MPASPFNDAIPVAKPWLPPFEEFAELARDIFEQRFVSNFAKYNGLLEQRAGAALGHKVLAVASCDVGMTLAWKALGLTRGEVIVPSFTFVSTVNAMVWNGLTPVFADIDPGTLCVAPQSVERLVTPDTVAIAAVHVFGEPVSEAIDRIAAERGLALLFDAAHGVGTTQLGRSLAGRGDATVFSLSGTKVVTAGEGGLAVFRDGAARERFRELRGYGFVGDYDAKATGLNGKLSELAAALGYLSLGMLDEMVARRAEIAARYRSQLEGKFGLRMQPEPPPGDLRSYKDLVVIFPDSETREMAETSLANREVGTKRYFLPIHTMQAYRRIEARSPLEVTDDIYSRSLCLPIFHDLADDQIDFVAEIVLESMSCAPKMAG